MVIITINIKIIKLCVEIKFSIIIHLGKNPKKGGSPPSLRKFINKQNLKIGEWLLNIKIWLILNKFIILKIIIIEKLIVV